MNKFGRRSLAVVALSFLVLTSAMADDKSGWAISATVGDTELRDVDADGSFQGGDVGLSAEVEYRFSEHFALGIGGFTLGRADDIVAGVDTELEVRGYDVFGRVIYPISHDSELFGRVGLANYFVDIDPGTVSLDDALFGRGALELGVGVDFSRRKNLAFRLEGRYFNGDNDESAVLIALGINYLF